MSPIRGIVLKLLSVAVFMVMAVCIKYATDEVPAGEAVFFRSFFALPVIFVWLAWQGQLRNGLKAKNPMGHVWRGVMGTVAMALNFAALGLLPLPEATAISYAAPLLVVMFAAMFLGEHVGLFRLSTVLLGMIGVLVVLAPSLTLLSEGIIDGAVLGACFGLGSAMCKALAQVFIRNLVKEETTSAIVFWFTITSSCLALLTAPFGWVMPTAGTFTILVAAGLLGGIGQILLTASFRHGEASLIAPFEYASMLLALLFGYVLFGELPTWGMLGGAGILIFSGVLIILRERYLGLKRGEARKNMTPQG